MKIAVCDDDINFLKEICSFVSDFFKNAGINVDLYKFNEVADLVKSMEHRTFDLYFLDIEIDQDDGIELARYISDIDSSAIFIFVTSHNARVYEVFSLNTFAFVRKSDLNNDLDEVTGRLLDKYKNLAKKYKIKLDNGKLIKISVDEVEYIERIGGHIEVGTKTSLMYRTAYRTITELEFCLDQFVETYRGVYANLKYIKSIGRDHVTMYSGKNLLMSRRKKNMVEEAFKNYMLE